jgi:hemerythrin-like domain-containing protein
LLLRRNLAAQHAFTSALSTACIQPLFFEESAAMARAHPQSADTPRDAIALLKADHRSVAELFEQFAAADAAQMPAIATRICDLLTVHAQIEEEILYPAARRALEEENEEEAELVNEATVEHATVKDLIAKIEAMTPEHETYRATVTVLGEYIKHHVQEEENEMLPALKQTELDLKELGTQLFERKLALMEELGISEEPLEIPHGRSRSGRSPTSRSGGRRNSTAKSSSRSARH